VAQQFAAQRDEVGLFIADDRVGQFRRGDETHSSGGNTRFPADALRK